MSWGHTEVSILIPALRRPSMVIPMSGDCGLWKHMAQPVSAELAGKYQVLTESTDFYQKKCLIAATLFMSIECKLLLLVHFGSIKLIYFPNFMFSCWVLHLKNSITALRVILLSFSHRPSFVLCRQLLISHDFRVIPGKLINYSFTTAWLYANEILPWIWGILPGLFLAHLFPSPSTGAVAQTCTAAQQRERWRAGTEGLGEQWDSCSCCTSHPITTSLSSSCSAVLSPTSH